VALVWSLKNANFYQTTAEQLDFVEGKPTIVAVAGRHGPWNRYLLPAAETWIACALSVANGANIWYGIYDANRADPRMNTVREINRLLSTHSDCLAGTTSVARVALVWSLKNANFYQTTAEQLDFVEGKTALEHRMKSDARRAFNGWFEVLSRSHRIFDVIDDRCLERGDLSRYDLIILPNVACMGEEECRAVRNYVAGGGNVIATWQTGRMASTVAMRYVGGAKLDNTWSDDPDDPRYRDGQGQLLYGSVDDNRVEPYLNFSLNGTFDLDLPRISHAELFGTVNNLFDKSPPFTGGGISGASAVYHDTMGRSYRMGVRLRF